MRKPIRAATRRREFHPICLLLLLGLIHSLLYILIIPPWQHYDEPTHFEYAWLLANQDGIPAQGEYDQGMRREVAASMIEHDFFKYLSYRPNLLSLEDPIWIGISQTGDRPFYYWIASLPLRLLRGTDITFQLNLGRMVSVLLYLSSILAAWGIAVELAPVGHPLRWLLPLSLVLLPGFTELMSAMNNDVGATAFFSLFLWSAIALLRRGFSWPRIGLCVVTVLACILTKSTVLAVIPLFAILVLFLIFTAPRRRLAWILLAAAGLVGILGLVTWSEAAYWYRSHIQGQPTRSRLEQPPLGKYALELVQSPGQPAVEMFHLLPAQEARRLGGKKVTLGAWVWASEPVELRMPLLYDGARSFSERIQVSTQPAFYTMSVTLDDHITKVTVMLAPGVTAVDKPVRVYYDGLVVIQGNRPPDPGPDFFDPEGQAGTWDGKPFTNLVRNGSFEKGWFGVRARVEQFIQTNYTVYSPAILASVYDWPGAGWYYQSAAKQLLQTFWGKFGWGHIPLAWKHSYRVLGLLTLAGLLGSLISLARRWQKVDKEILFFLIAALFVVWGVTFYRGIGSIDEATFIPSARYAFPVAILTMLAFTAGWLELLRLLSGGKTAWEKLQVALIGLFFAGLDILSVWSIVKFYG